MPAFAWLIKDVNGKAKMSPPRQHTCFAELPRFYERTLGYNGQTPLPSVYPFIFYAMCHGSYEDAVLFAEKVNESVLKKYPFTLKAYSGDTEGNPFSKAAWGTIKISSTYGLGQCYDAPYWGLEWPVGTQWDLVYAVTKLIFKNITYGHRPGKNDAHEAMMRFLREGANIFEAMVYQSTYEGNGYAYPLFIVNNSQAKVAYKFTQEGPEFNTSDWADWKLGGCATVSIYNNHKPFNHQVAGAPIQFGGLNKTTNLETFRAKLREAAGVN